LACGDLVNDDLQIAIWFSTNPSGAPKSPLPILAGGSVPLALIQEIVLSHNCINHQGCSESGTWTRVWQGYKAARFARRPKRGRVSNDEEMTQRRAQEKSSS
jgi:hypothetical protein